MTHRRNIRDVQQAGEPSVAAALCVREKGFSACASCGEFPAAGGVGRTRRGGLTQRATPRGLDCVYRVPHLAT